MMDITIQISYYHIIDNEKKGEDMQNCLWWLGIYCNILYRTLTIIVWKNGMAAVITPVIVGVVSIILPLYYNRMSESLSMTQRMHIRRLIRIIWSVFGFSIIILLVTGYSNQFTEEMPSLLGKKVKEVPGILEEAGIFSAELEYLSEMDEGDFSVVTEQIPEPGAGVRKTGGRVYLVTENGVSYGLAADPGNYSCVQVGTEDAMSFCIPQEMFEAADAEAVYGNPGSLQEMVYMQGFEEGLYVWAGYEIYDDFSNMEDVFQEYRLRFAGDLTEISYIGTDISNTRIITGVAYRPVRVVVYFAMAVKNGILQMLFIAYPFETVMTEEEYADSGLKSYSCYSEYMAAEMESYRIKSYLAAMVFWTCSFGSDECMEPYDSYEVDWEIPCF